MSDSNEIDIEMHSNPLPASKKQHIQQDQRSTLQQEEWTDDTTHVTTKSPFFHQCHKQYSLHQIHTWTTRKCPSCGYRYTLFFLEEVLRAHSQVIFCNSPLSGLLTLTGLLITDYEAALFGFLATVVATLAAYLLSLDNSNGLYGFNGQLVGMAVGVLLPRTYTNGNSMVLVRIFMCFIFSTLSVIVANALRKTMASFELPFLTLPFNIAATWLLVGGQYYSLFGTSTTTIEVKNTTTASYHPRSCLRLSMHAECAYDISGLVQMQAIVQAFFDNFSQIFILQSQPQLPFVTGGFILIGIGCYSPLAMLFAAIGSGTAVGTALILGVDGYEIVQGLWGYNSILTAVALGGGIGFVETNWKSSLFAVFGSAVTVMMHGFLRTFFGTMNASALTLPFCLTTILFLLLRDQKGSQMNGKDPPLLFDKRRDE